jgi:hypothetical protein
MLKLALGAGYKAGNEVHRNEKPESGTLTPVPFGLPGVHVMNSS